jgi:hypothetical protein
MYKPLKNSNYKLKRAKKKKKIIGINLQARGHASSMIIYYQDFELVLK